MVRHRVVAAVVAIVILGALFVAFLGVKIGLAGSASLAKRGPAFDAFQQLKQRWHLDRLADADAGA